MPCVCIKAPCNCASTPVEAAAHGAQIAIGSDRFANAMSGMKWLGIAAGVLLLLAALGSRR